MPQICYKYCTPLFPYRVKRLITFDSAELEITVQLLVQIDKLVQLIESPVFTCAYHFLSNWTFSPDSQMISSRSSTAITRA